MLRWHPKRKIRKADLVFSCLLFVFFAFVLCAFTKTDPGSRYGSTGDPESVLVPGQAKITKSERHFSVYITKS